MKKEAIELLQYRIQQEQLSSRIYESMSMWLDNNGYLGSAKLWAKYSAEELKHADFAKEYLLSFGINPTLRKLDAPVCEFKGLCEIIDMTFDHETEISRQCSELAASALAMGDHMLYTLGLKYCAEQVEEMSKSQTLKDLVKAFGESKEALFLLDNKLGEL